MLEDAYGMRLSIDSTTALAHFTDAQEALLGATGDAIAAAEAALAAEPRFVLAHCARARGLQLAGRFLDARTVAEHAVELAAGATPWEQAHAAIALDLMSGAVDAAHRKLLPHVAEYPRDVLSALAATGVFGLIGFSGRVDREREQVDYLDTLRSYYGDDWWFATAYAFALAEADRVDEAWPHIERARLARPRSGHVAHTHMHVAIEAARDLPQRAWLEPWLADYDPSQLLHCHLWWHLALVALAERDFATVRRALHEHCLPGRSGAPPINLFTDCVALLWRAELAGEPHDEATWRQVLDYGAQWFPRPGIFVDVHHALGLAATGQLQRLDEFVANQREQLGAGRVRAGGVVIELATAFGEFARADYAACAARLDACAADVVRIGGSRAQRRIVTLTRDAARARC